MLHKEVLSETPFLIPSITRAAWLGSVPPKAHQSINPLSVSEPLPIFTQGTEVFLPAQLPQWQQCWELGLLSNKFNLVLHPQKDLLGKVTSRVFITEEYFSSAPQC